MSTISAQNERVNTEVFSYLQNSIQYMADANWMMEEDQALNVKMGNQMAEMGKKMNGVF